MGMPFIIGTLVILAEFVGSIGVIIGLGTRFMAASIPRLTMSGCNGSWRLFTQRVLYELVWYAKRQKVWSIFILIIALALATVIGGSGKFFFRQSGFEANQIRHFILYYTQMVRACQLTVGRLFFME